MQAFKAVGIDANSSEKTPDEQFIKKIAAWNSLPQKKKETAREKLRTFNNNEIQEFIQQLELAISRQLVSVRVLPLHGAVAQWNLIDDAIVFIHNYQEDNNQHPVARYEIELLYSNGDKINGSFGNKLSAIQFLRDYECVILTPAL